jgi:asparagine synthase (glutamine-hydrolysing)
MAHSLEARLPFMDYRLVEFCFALPADAKIRGTTTKWLLRQSMRGIVPDRILDRRDKIGFATPFADWIRTDLRDFMVDILDGQSTREHGVFDVAELRKVIQRHLKGQINMSFYIWRWMTTELWLRQLDDLHAESKSLSGCLPRPTTKEPIPCDLQ